MEIPTGHGKTLIIAALAIADANQIMLVVLMNAFLSQYEFRLFEGLRGVDNFPCDIHANKVIYMSCSELMGFPE